MKVSELSRLSALSALQLSDETIDIDGIYCCDLLSWAMAHAQAGMVWVTVISNLNTLAVASLTEVAAVIIAEDQQVDEACIQKAREQGLNLFQSRLPVYETARSIEQLGLEQTAAALAATPAGSGGPQAG